jgi:hypothetical protein
MWENSGYTGEDWTYIGTGGGGPYNYNTWYYTGSYFNDLADSLYNNRPDGSLVDKDYPPSGDEVCILSQYAYSNLGDYEWPDDTSMADSISSFNLTSTADC